MVNPQLTDLDLERDVQEILQENTGEEGKDVARQVAMRIQKESARTQALVLIERSHQIQWQMN